MNKRCNFLDILLEKSERIRISHHDTCDSIIKQRLQIFHIYKSHRIGLYLNNF